MSRIEQRQRHIRLIRENLSGSPTLIQPEDITVNTDARFNVATSQKNPVHIPTFLQQNLGDPAVKVSGLALLPCTLFHTYPQDFLPKLRAHLLPRIQAVLEGEAKTHPEFSTAVNMFPPSLDDMTRNFVFFKHESLYQHKTIRVNYTTYDIRRGTDIVKPEGPCCNIMLLANHTGGSNLSNLHHFIYARVLGVYHADVIYTGPGARAFQMLWVRWYEVVDPGSSGWDNSTLDMLRFPPLHQDNSFGFVDPDVVLRGCHILPAFGKGKQESSVNVSRSAKDNKDYRLYYVDRLSSTIS